MAKPALRLDPRAGNLFLELVHACTAGCESADAFRELLRRHVAPLVPHRCSIAVLGGLSLDRLVMHHLIGIDHSEPFLSSISAQLNIRDRPVVARWIATREPVVIDAERDRDWLSELERREFARYRLGRLAIHGQIDLSAQMGSCFSFAGVDEEIAEPQLRYLLSLIAPHLHAAFVGVPYVRSQARAAVGLTQVEQELLAWLARGRTNADIARARRRSPATIRNQLHALYAKLEVGSR